jgi:hypothetical protein
LVTKLVKQHLQRACLRMKHQAEKGRFERLFEVGDLVFLKLQPYVQSSLAAHTNQKLAFKFFGPFSILQKVVKVAYKLDLPPAYSIHPMFHVLQLKKAVGSKIQVTPWPQQFSEHNIPEKILQRRLVTSGVRTLIQVLVKWSDSLKSLATWEDMEALKQRFPRVPTWGQVAAYGGGNVTVYTPATGSAPSNKDEVAGRECSARVKKPNTRVYGPEWAAQ